MLGPQTISAKDLGHGKIFRPSSSSHRDRRGRLERGVAHDEATMVEWHVSRLCGGTCLERRRNGCFNLGELPDCSNDGCEKLVALQRGTKNPSARCSSCFYLRLEKSEALNSMAWNQVPHQLIWIRSRRHLLLCLTRQACGSGVCPASQVLS